MLKLATVCSCEYITGGGGGECNLPIVSNEILYLFIPETNADVSKHSISYCMKFYIHPTPLILSIILLLLTDGSTYQLERVTGMFSTVTLKG